MVILIRVIYVNVLYNSLLWLIGPHGLGPMSHLLGSNGPASITLKLRSKNTNNRKYFHNIIFHYLRQSTQKIKHKND